MTASQIRFIHPIKRNALGILGAPREKISFRTNGMNSKMKTVPLFIINRSDRNAKHRIDQILHSNWKTFVFSLGNRVLIKDIRPNCTVSSWRRQCCGCPQNPSVQHTFQFKTPLSSTPKTP